MTRRPKLPIPPEVLVTEEGWVTPPWYQYFLGQDKGWRIPVDFITTASTASNILSGRITVFASTPGVVHTLEDPEAGMETTLVCTVPSTQAGSITVRAATDVAIGPGGENGSRGGEHVTILYQKPNDERLCDGLVVGSA
jgi:hypothetical protein